MTVSRVDPEARSTLAAADGFRALTVGDTVLARQKYTEAGEILERASKMSLPASDKHLLRFLAASQYYRAGEYKRADKLAERVNPGYLPSGHHAKLAQFRKDVRARTADDYAINTRFAVVENRVNGKTREAVKLLQDHPYVVDRSTLAWMRADLCYQERNWKAAALFYSDAIRFSDSDPKMLYLCAAGALGLHTDGFTEEAWQYTELLLEYAPNALTLIVSCALRLNRLASHDRPGADELVATFQQAEARYQQLPERVRTHPEVQDFLAYGFVVAAGAFERAGDLEAAQQICQQALGVIADSRYVSVIEGVLSGLQQRHATADVGASEVAESLRRRQTTLTGEILRNAA